MGDLVLIWLSMFGIWPVADPGHTGTAPLVLLDLAIHATASIVLAWRIYLWRQAWERQEASE